MSEHITTNRKPNLDDPQWYLVVHRLPWWFGAAIDLCSRWPLWRFYQGYQRWWWAKLDTFPSVRFPISDERQQAMSDFWEREREQKK